MSQQLKITVPLPPAGSEYLRVFEEFFTAAVPPTYLQELKGNLERLKSEVSVALTNLSQTLQTATTPHQVQTVLSHMRNQHRRIFEYMDATPLPPSLDEIAGSVILDTYFLSGEDGGAVIAEMKAVCLKRFKAAFPNVDRDSYLRTQELLDSVFKSVSEFYECNKTSDEYMRRLIDYYDTFIPSLIAINPLGGLDIYMQVDIAPPKMTPSEAKQIEVQYGKDGKIAPTITVS